LNHSGLNISDPQEADIGTQ